MNNSNLNITSGPVRFATSVPITTLINGTNTNLSKLVKIKKTCDNNHNHCREIVNIGNKYPDEVTQEYFNEFFTIVKGTAYNCCLSNYGNNKCKDIKYFIIKCSERLVIPTWESLLTYLVDIELLEVIKNQERINPNFMDVIELDYPSPNGYGAKVNFINYLLNHPIKMACFDYIIMMMEIDKFVKYISKSTKQITTSYDNVIIKYIKSRKDILKLAQHKDKAMKIINHFIGRPQIIKSIYAIMSSLLTPEQKTDIFNKSISLLDKELLFLLLENRDIKPNLDTINKLTEKCYARPEGATNSKQIADIIDLLIEYGLEINKQIILKLLDHGCYVNNLEKTGIKVDSEILAKCANHSYYPYKFDIKPETGILIKECSKHDNLNTIKKLKEFGGIYTKECLEEACGVTKNGRVIKFLLTECGVKVSEEALIKFQEAYKIEALDLLVKNYKLNQALNNDSVSQTDKKIEIDKNSIMTVSPRNVNINISDDSVEYELKKKIQKFFELKKKTIKYSELYQNMLKYLITNNLVIGNYFVINEKLSSLLKINNCTILHTDQINNILTYFIDPIQ